MKGRPGIETYLQSHTITYDPLHSWYACPLHSQNSANCEPCKKPSPATLTFFTQRKPPHTSCHAPFVSGFMMLRFMFRLMLLSWGAVMDVHRSRTYRIRARLQDLQLFAGRKSTNLRERKLDIARLDRGLRRPYKSAHKKKSFRTLNTRNLLSLLFALASCNYKRH